MKIYILDDKDYYVTILKERLEKKGYSVIASTDPYTAEKEISEIKDIDLILIDYNMPILNGLEVLKRLKKRDDFIFPKIFVMANDIPEDDIIEIRKFSSNIIFKPFILSELEENIEYVFGKEIIESELKKPENSEIATFRKVIEDMRKRIDELEKDIRNKNIRLDEKDRRILELQENQKLFVEKIRENEDSYDEMNTIRKNLLEKDLYIEELERKLMENTDISENSNTEEIEDLRKKNLYYRAYIHFIKGNLKKSSELTERLLIKYPDYDKALKLQNKLN